MEEKFAWCRLQPGVRPKHLASFFVGAFLTIGLAVLINALQPHLIVTTLKVDARRAGTIAGTSASIAELFLIAGAALWGAFSDKVGRRTVYVLGMFGVGLGFALSPLIGSTTELYALRCVYAVGMAAAAGMLATLVADYVVDTDRGKATGIMGLMNGLGAGLCAGLLSRLPGMLERAGFNVDSALWITYLSVGGSCVLGAIFLRWGLAGRETQSREREVPVGRLVKEGIAAANDNFGVGLAYLMAFVARADLAIAGVFLPQWCVSHFMDQGVENAASAGVAQGGALIAVMGASSLLAAPLFGMLTDRIHRATAVAIALGVNAVGYGATYFVSDPSAGAIWIVAAIIGTGEVAGVITTQVFVQEQAPARTRGSVIGVFGMFGGLGIATNAWIGGQLFERWMYAGPFVWVAGVNLVVATLVLLSRGRVPVGQPRAREPAGRLHAHRMDELCTPQAERHGPASVLDLVRQKPTG